MPLTLNVLFNLIVKVFVKTLLAMITLVGAEDILSAGLSSLGINSPSPGPKSRPSEQEAGSAVGGGSPSAQTKGSQAGTSPVVRFFVETNRSAQALRHRSVPNRQVRC